MGPLLFVRYHPQLWGYTGKAHLAVTEHMLQEEIQFCNFLFFSRHNRITDSWRAGDLPLFEFLPPAPVPDIN